jgi:5,10-methylenetetrahydromethanopterin reductase
VRLVHPPREVPPVIAGVIGPRSLELAGRVADGTLIVEGRGPAEVAGIRALIDKGRTTANADADGERPHTLQIFTHLCIDEDPDKVRATLAPIIADYSEMLGVPPQEVFTVSGGPADVAAQVRSLWQAGIETVILRPVGERPAEQFVKAVAAVREH